MSSFFLRKIQFPSKIKPRIKFKSDELFKIKPSDLIPSCINCKYSVKSKSGVSCKLLNPVVSTEVCRNVGAFCGPKGAFFKLKKINK